jgi:hypothetical protein
VIQWYGVICRSHYCKTSTGLICGILYAFLSGNNLIWIHVIQHVLFALSVCNSTFAINSLYSSKSSCRLHIRQLSTQE